MNETYTFLDCTKRFALTVKPRFLKVQCGQPWHYGMYELINDFDLINYLHNPSGPAVSDTQTGECHYYINGELVKDSDAMMHVVHFNNKLMDVLA